VVTATGLLLLAQEGAFDLDDPVNDHLRGYRVAHDDPTSPPVTFRHLLTHSSGASSSFEHWVEEVPDVESLVGPVLRCEFVPGTAHTYSNGGFATIGKLIEDISGEDLPGFMQRRVLAPLGMERSEYRASNVIGDEWAVGHQLRRGAVSVAPATVPSVLGAGSLWSTATDLVRFGAAMSSTSTLLREPFASMMFEPQGPPATDTIDQGLAWLLDKDEPHRIAWHNGGGHGFSTTLAVTPGTGVAVAVLSNVGGQDPSPPTKQMLRVVLDALV
jgi:CubicO group peptidase (beta-lactamase class C family)